MPVYSSSEQTGCPTNSITITGSGTSVTTPTGVEQAALISGNYLVKPSDNTLHQAYSFYVKVGAQGGSSHFFGPYVLNVGCNNAFVTYADNAAFVSSVSKNVGDATSSVYTFSQPTVS